MGVADLLTHEAAFHRRQPGHDRRQGPKWEDGFGQPGTSGKDLKLIQRGQHFGCAGLEHGVGKAQVGRVVRHGDGHVVIDHARQEQHLVVVEKVAQLLLHVANRSHLEQAT